MYSPLQLEMTRGCISVQGLMGCEQRLLTVSKSKKVNSQDAEENRPKTNGDKQRHATLSPGQRKLQQQASFARAGQVYKVWKYHLTYYIAEKKIVCGNCTPFISLQFCLSQQKEPPVQGWWYESCLTPAENASSLMTVSRTWPLQGGRFLCVRPLLERI